MMKMLFSTKSFRMLNKGSLDEAYRSYFPGNRQTILDAMPLTRLSSLPSDTLYLFACPGKMDDSLVRLGLQAKNHYCAELRQF